MDASEERDDADLRAQVSRSRGVCVCVCVRVRASVRACLCGL